MFFGLSIPASLHPSFELPEKKNILIKQIASKIQLNVHLQVQYSMKMLYDPVRMRQNLSSPSIPGSPIHAHDRKYLHSPCTFCRIFLHIVALTPGKCSFGSTCLQSVIESVLLSNGSAHFGSESLRHSQHLIASPKSD